MQFGPSRSSVLPLGCSPDAIATGRFQRTSPYPCRNPRGASLHRLQPFQPPGTRCFRPFTRRVADQGDHYMHLADLKSYLEADERLRELYSDAQAWARKAILNVSGSE